MARLKAAEVIAQSKTGMSQATLYRAADNGRCYRSLRFAVPLTPIDLSGITLSKLGLSDDISSPDHEGMLWLGCMIDAVIADQDGPIAGIGYPSRKQRGHQSTAISSRSIAALAPGLTVVVQPFGATAACAALKADRCRWPPPR